MLQSCYVDLFLLYSFLYILLSFAIGYFSQIFIPVVHLNHWFFIVISILEEKIYVLDSFPSESRLQLIVEIYSRLKQYFLDSNSEFDISNYEWSILPVQHQGNRLVISFTKNNLVSSLLLLLPQIF